MPSLPGDKLGPYEISRSDRARAAWARCTSATDPRLGRFVAIKVSHSEFNERFEREARAIAALNHPNICTLYDVGPNYLVMEYIEGERSRRSSRVRCRSTKPCSMPVQIADALAAAHDKGIIHRDLKPGNIMITGTARRSSTLASPRLGTSRVRAAEPRSSPSPSRSPRPARSSARWTTCRPSKSKARRPTSAPTSSPSASCLYEMITGHRPFSGDTQAAVLAAILKDQPVPMSQRQPATPRALERIVRRCLEKRPAERWRSADALKAAIETIDLDAAPTNMSSASVSVPIPGPNSAKPWLVVAEHGGSSRSRCGGRSVFLPASTARSPPEAVCFEITQPETASSDTCRIQNSAPPPALSAALSLSPHGRKLASSITIGVDNINRLWVRNVSKISNRGFCREPITWAAFRFGRQTVAILCFRPTASSRKSRPPVALRCSCATRTGPAGRRLLDP